MLLLGRARDVLTQAGVDPGLYTNPSAVTGREDKDSRVELCFHCPDRLREAKLAITALSKAFTQGERKFYVWLDAKKERSETRPR